MTIKYMCKNISFVALLVLLIIRIFVHYYLIRFVCRLWMIVHNSRIKFVRNGDSIK
jgi:hypothetical protein